MARPRSEVPHAEGIEDETKEELLRRLSRIRGQVDGIRKMVEEERYCPDVLQQFDAVHSAMKSTQKLLLASHLERCATAAIEEGGEKAAQVREEIVELFARYME